MIDTRTLQILIQIGQEGTAESPSAVALLQEIRHEDHINRLGPEKWYAIAERMTLADLEALVKGLTLVESVLGWLGGSASAVIWTYRVFGRRADADLQCATTDWIRQHTHNPYLPFGSMKNAGAKSLQEYHEWCRLEQESSRIRQEQKRLKEEEEQHVAFMRRQARSKEHAAKAGQRLEERQRLVAELAAMDPVSRLQRIAEATGPLGFYPEEWADESDAVLRSLPVAVRLSLVKRVQGRRGGQWRLLLDRLRALESRGS
ncbi:hypothetical protein IMZ48_48240 [Candidatus Bathyarchaeota archaeon]|nr:hypothetical protein [Candidatus Bathyarchaeota archaeon]